MGLIKRFQKWAQESRYATWQIYVCVISVLSFISLSIELDFVIEFLQWLDQIHIVNGRSADEVTTVIFQSVLTGAFAYFTYDNGDRYFKSNITKQGLFDSKETAFFVMIVALGFAGFFPSIAIPKYVRSNAEFVVMQVGGATLTLGYGLIHLEISTWKLINELPAISAGIIFAVGPMVVM